jgi:hypothetical protein
MDKHQARLFLQLYRMAEGTGINRCLVDGPIRGKRAAAMAEAGWLKDGGAIGDLGRAYVLTEAGVAAYNSYLDASR